jgi:hypothetical protein
MAAKRVSKKQAEALIDKFARASARRLGIAISDSAIAALTAPSRAYFQGHGEKITIGEKKLAQQIDVLVKSAASQAAPVRPASVISGRNPMTGRALVLGRSPDSGAGPRRAAKEVDRTHVAKAMKRSKCHYLWFC